VVVGLCPRRNAVAGKMALPDGWKEGWLEEHSLQEERGLYSWNARKMAGEMESLEGCRKGG